jgi:hypothetical protein
MKTSMFMAAVVLVLAVTGGFLIAYRFQPGEDAKTKDKPNFPFTTQDCPEGVCVYLAPKYYQKRSLEDICLWFHRNQLGKRDLAVFFFTDEALMKSFIDDPRYAVHYDTDEPKTKTTEESSSARRSKYDATCFRCLSEPSLEPDADPSSSGSNLTLNYAPDLKQPNVKKTVVLRGATWTEGKYNLETQEVLGPTDKITVTAYNIYNVDPPGRYYTFSYNMAKDKYPAGRVIFNFRQDEGIPPPINQVRFITDEVAYVYMGWMYSVTTDAGKTWRLWDAEKDLPGWKCCDPGLIRDVAISAQGTGTLTLRPDSGQPEKLLFLRTNDFGRHWAVQ